MTDAETEEIIKIARERDEMEFLFQITKIVAETDSIGEAYGYCDSYTRAYFNNGDRHKNLNRGTEEYDQYLQEAGAPIYKLYLRRIRCIQYK